MALLVLAFLIGLPLVEIAGFVYIGEEIGAAATIVATVLTAAIGIAVVRIQGAGVARRARAAFARNQEPVAETIEGLALGLAGILLFLPGFVSDGVGVLLLLPPFRYLMVWMLLGYLRKRVAEARRQRDNVLEGEYRDVTPKDEDRLP
ncbi:MAG: FxsA family protein [Alphaproteobacteria bacterium]|jgi:UPF0716 protein FxsA|nr:FxsA family protein [Alphaproteobacteria bacterium]